MDSSCQAAAQNLLSLATSSPCQSVIIATISDSVLYGCTSGTDGVDCLNPYSIIAAKSSVSHMISPWQLRSQSSCPICDSTTSTGVHTGCKDLLQGLHEAASGVIPDASVFAPGEFRQQINTNKVRAELSSHMSVTQKSSRIDCSASPSTCTGRCSRCFNQQISHFSLPHPSNCLFLRTKL